MGLMSAGQTVLPKQSDGYALLVERLTCDVIRDLSDLHDYQDVAVDFLEENPFSALFIDLGLGKTIISLTLIARLIDKFLFNKVLIIAPLRVANETWPTEISQWSHTALLPWAHLREEEITDEIDAAAQVARDKAKRHHIGEAEAMETFA